MNPSVETELKQIHNETFNRDVLRSKYAILLFVFISLFFVATWGSMPGVQFHKRPHTFAFNSYNGFPT